MATAEKILNQSQTYSDNIVPSFAMFDDSFSWSVSSGSGSGTHDDQYKFAGDRSLKLINTDVKNTDLVISSGTNTQFNIDRSGNYILSFYALTSTQINASVQIFVSGVPTDYDFTISDSEEFDKWTRRTQLLTLNAGDKITFNVKLKQDTTSVPTSATFWLDGFMCNEDDRNLGYPPRFKSSAATSNNGGVSLDNRVIVKTAADFGTIDSTKEYFIDGIIDMGATSVEVPAGGINISGYNFDLSQLISTEDNYTMFMSPIGGSGNVLPKDIGISVSGATSKVYDLTAATGNEAFEFQRVNYNGCTSLGEITNYRQGLENGTGRFGGTPELTLSGVWLGGYSISDSIVRGLTDGVYSLFKAGTGFAMSSRFKSNMNIDLPASASYFDFSDTNFPNSSTLQLNSMIISRDGVFDANDANLTPNIDNANLACQWVNNKGLRNTFEGGELDLTTEVSTTIAVADTFVDLLGTYTVNNLEHFDSPANGQLRHLGDNPIEYTVNANYILDSSSGDEVTIKLVIFRDATSSFEDAKSMTRVINNLQGGRDVAYYTFIDNIVLNANDYVKFQVANNNVNNVTAELNSYYIINKR